MFVERKAPGMELIDVLDRVLDKGAVIDASARLRLLVTDLQKRRTRVVVVSIETYSALAENRPVTSEPKLKPAKDNRRRSNSRPAGSPPRL